MLRLAAIDRFKNSDMRQDIMTTGFFCRKNGILFLLILLCAGMMHTASAANRFAVASGNWNGAIWAATINGTPGSVATPTSSDVVTINANQTVSINVAAAARTLTVNGTLQFNTNNDLTMANAGSVTINNGGVLIFNTNGQIRGGANNANGILVVINSGASLQTQNTLGFRTGTGNTTLTGSIAVRPGNRGAPSYSTGADYTFNGTSAQQTGNAITGANLLEISNPAGVTATNALSVNTLVTASGATLDMGTNSLSLTAATHAGSLFTQNISATPITAGMNWGGTVAYNGTGAQTIVPGFYTDLDASGGNRTLSTADTIYIAGSFTPGTGIFTVTGSVVDFNREGDQEIPDFSFHNLVLSGSGIKSIRSSIQVICKNLLVDDAANLSIDGAGGGGLRVQ
jgi:hypothetical protein